MSSEKVVRNAVIKSIKKEFINAKWWHEVQDDVKNRLNWIVDRIDEVGPLFCLSFMALFRWEYERRIAEGERTNQPMASYLAAVLGMRISEEAFQCGRLPTRAVLNLYDFVDPNDSDVAACIFLCHQIELLQKTGMISMTERDIRTNPTEMAKLLKQIPEKKISPIQEKKIDWEDEDLKN